MLQRNCVYTAPDGVKPAYAIAGDGPPLLRVFSWHAYLELNWNSPAWWHWWDGFSRDHTFVHYDGMVADCLIAEWMSFPQTPGSKTWRP